LSDSCSILQLLQPTLLLTRTTHLEEGEGKEEGGGRRERRREGYKEVRTHEKVNES